MKITITKSLLDNKYITEFKTEFPDQEIDLIEKFGDPLINVGGSITGPPAFVLSDEHRKLKGGFPYTLSMDADGDTQAKDKMLAWIEEIRARMLTAITTLRGQVDDFSGEIVETI